MKRRLHFVLFDVFFLTVSFLFVACLKSATVTVVLPTYSLPFVLFLITWLIFSFHFKKYNSEKYINRREILYIILKSNFVSLALGLLVLYTFTIFNVSRLIYFGTILTATVLEILAALIYNHVHTSKVIDYENDFKEFRSSDFPETDTLVSPPVIKKRDVSDRQVEVKLILEMIESEYGKDVKDFISEYLMTVSGPVQVVSTTTRYNIFALPEKQYGCIVNFHKINDFRWLNKFFETVNDKVLNEGYFIGRVETYTLRKKRIISKYLFPFNYVVYTFDVIFRRVFPKLSILKRFYFWITKGKNRALSQAETFGRLYSCGFTVLDDKNINGKLYFVSQKVKEPSYPSDPTYGPLVRLRRIGKGGKYFYVYKMRTMHPYSEYIQQFVYEKNRLEKGGKFKDDFRVTTLGKFLRKFWLDELPMLINVLKGDIKIVGVRPLSSHYYNLYSEELKQYRIKFKPGLIPPYYADMPESFEEIMESEWKYLMAYEKHPFRTDVKYFFAALKNIIFKNARSK